MKQGKRTKICISGIIITMWISLLYIGYLKSEIAAAFVAGYCFSSVILLLFWPDE